MAPSLTPSSLDVGTIGRTTRSLARGVLSRQMIHDHAIKAVGMEPNDPFVLISCTYALSLIGEPSLALPLAEEAIRTFPPARPWASFPLVRLGRGDEAIQASRNILKWGLSIAPEYWSSTRGGGSRPAELRGRGGRRPARPHAGGRSGDAHPRPLCQCASHARSTRRSAGAVALRL